MLYIDITATFTVRVDGGKAFRYASKNSTARLADGSDVHT